MESSGLISPNSTIALTVPTDSTPKRIDAFLASHFSHYSRTFFATLIDKDLITLNGSVVRKQSILVKSDDAISVTFPSQDAATPVNEAALALDVKIVYEHEHFLVISKPANLIVHKPSAHATSITLVDWLLATYHDIASVGYLERPGIVHRLDKDTSGLMVIARTNYAHTVFGAMFKERTMEKTYLALVYGHPNQTGSIDLAIGRNPFTRNKMTTFSQHLATENSSNGIRKALSNYTVLDYFAETALVQVKPLTGRTHQIRIHLSTIGHGIVGDALYSKRSPLIQRQALHAYSLSFVFDNQPFTFTQELPQDFADAIASARTKK